MRRRHVDLDFAQDEPTEASAVAAVEEAASEAPAAEQAEQTEAPAQEAPEETAEEETAVLEAAPVVVERSIKSRRHRLLHHNRLDYPCCCRLVAWRVLGKRFRTKSTVLIMRSSSYASSLRWSLRSSESSKTE